METLLFSPLTLGDVTLKNRFFIAALATQYADKHGFTTQVLVDYYKHLALTGAALVVVEGASIASHGRGWSRQLSAFRAEDIDSLAKIAQVIIDNGSIPILQLHHAGRQALHQQEGQKTIAPSAIPCPVLNRPVRILRTEEITGLIMQFNNAASIAMKAGFVGVELHGAHGYLLHQFVSPLTNKRDDEYRVTPDGICRFPLEVVRSIRAGFPDALVSYRMSARDYLPGGLDLKRSVIFAKALEGAGASMISISGGMYASLHGPDSVWGSRSSEAVFRDDARDIREAVNCPVGVAGRIQYPSTAFTILKNVDAHLIGLGRVILRDPDYILKAAGKDHEPVRLCLLCQRCKWHIKGCPDGASKPFHLQS